MGWPHAITKIDGFAKPPSLETITLSAPAGGLICSVTPGEVVKAVPPRIETPVGPVLHAPPLDTVTGSETAAVEPAEFEAVTMHVSTCPGSAACAVYVGPLPTPVPPLRIHTYA